MRQSIRNFRPLYLLLADITLEIVVAKLFLYFMWSLYGIFVTFQDDNPIHKFLLGADRLVTAATHGCTLRDHVTEVIC